MTPIWIVVYRHRFGADAFLMVQDEEPTENEAIALLDDFDPDNDEYVEIFRSDMTMPKSIVETELYAAAQHLINSWDKNLTEPIQRLATAVFKANKNSRKK